MIALAKAALNKNEALFTSKLDVNLRKKPVNCYIWSITLILKLGTLQEVEIECGSNRLPSVDNLLWKR